MIDIPDWLMKVMPGPSFKATMARALTNVDPETQGPKRTGRPYKVQTCRPVGLEPCESPYMCYGQAHEDIAEARDDAEVGDWLWGEEAYPEEGTFVSNPRYRPGVIYYAREPVSRSERCHVEPGVLAMQFTCDETLPLCPAQDPLDKAQAVGWHKHDDDGEWAGDYKNSALPGRYMPRLAARTFFRVEVAPIRIRDIPPGEVVKEGVVSPEDADPVSLLDRWRETITWIYSYEEWDRNDWFWKYTLKHLPKWRVEEELR